MLLADCKIGLKSGGDNTKPFYKPADGCLTGSFRNPRFVLICFEMMIDHLSGFRGGGDHVGRLFLWSSHLPRSASHQPLRLAESPEDLLQTQQLLHQDPTGRGEVNFFTVSVHSEILSNQMFVSMFSLSSLKAQSALNYQTTERLRDCGRFAWSITRSSGESLIITCSSGLNDDCTC